MIQSVAYDLAHSGNVDGVREWLQANPDQLNAFVGDGYTLLHVACMFGHETLASFLLARGALVSLNAHNVSRVTPLHLAVTFRDERIAEKLIRVLIDHGAELNGQQAGGQTALHHAVARQSLRLVQVLISAGADPFLKDQQGRGPIDLVDLGGLSNERNNGQLQTQLRNQLKTELKRVFSLPFET